MKTKHTLCLMFVQIVALITLSGCCGLTTRYQDQTYITHLMDINKQIITYCEKQDSTQHTPVKGELEKLNEFKKQIVSNNDEMVKLKCYHQNISKIALAECDDIDGFIKTAVGSNGKIPENYYLVFASHIRQRNANIQSFLEH